MPEVFYQFDPDWQNIKIYRLKDKSSVLLIPVSRKLNINYYQIGFLRKLSIKIDQKNRVTEGKFIEILGSASILKEKKDQLFEDYYENRLKDFTGSIITYNLAYQRISGNSYKKGQLEATTARIEIKSDSEHEKPNSPLTTHNFGPAPMPFVIPFIWYHDFTGGGSGNGNWENGVPIYAICAGDCGGSGYAPGDPGHGFINDDVNSRATYISTEKPITESRTQGLTNVPFRSIYDNSTKTIYIVKPSPAERKALTLRNLIIHYAGHGISPGNSPQPSSQTFSSPNELNIIFLGDDATVNNFVSEKGLAGTRPLPSATVEAEVANYYGNYKLIYKQDDGQLVITDYTKMISLAYIHNNVTTNEAKNKIIIDQADIWKPSFNFKHQYESSYDENVRNSLVEAARNMLQTERDSQYNLDNNNMQGFFLVLGKFGAPPQELLNILSQRNQNDFRQAIVICGDLGVLIW